MNRNKTILPAFFAVALTICLFSCAKKQSPDTPFSLMQGKWKLTQIAPDGGNSPLVYTPLNKEEDWEWTFNSNSTGFDIENWNGQEGIKENFSFKIVSGDSIWIGTATHDTTVYFISVVNSDYMIWTKTYLNDTGAKITEGRYFNRN